MICGMAGSRKSSKLILPPGGEISLLPVEERQDIRLMPQFMVRTGMPYIQVPAEKPWVRKNGDLTVTMWSGMGQDESGNEVPIGLPYGIYPRLTGMWTATQVKRQEARGITNHQLILGENLADFMNQLGIEKQSGGPRGTQTLLRQQCDRLFSSVVSVRKEYRHKGTGQNGVESSRGMVATHHSLYWSTNSKRQDELLPSTVTLSPEYYAMCLDSPVPVDANTIRKLRGEARGSAMRLDVYVWLTHKMAVTKHIVLVPWESMLPQFGSSVDPNSRQGVRKFRLGITDALERVLEVYDKAAARADEKGIWLLPGGTDVRPSQSRELLALEKQWREDVAAERAALF